MCDGTEAGNASTYLQVAMVNFVKATVHTTEDDADSSSKSDSQSCNAILVVTELTKEPSNEDSVGCVLQILDASGTYRASLPHQRAEQVLQYFSTPENAIREQASGPPSSVDRSNSDIHTELFKDTRTNCITARVWMIDENDMVKNCLMPTTLQCVSSDAHEHILLLLNVIDQRETQRDLLRGLEEARDSWRSTAEELEGGWEREKTRLLRNFLELYNGRKDLFHRALENEKRLEHDLKVANDRIVQMDKELNQARLVKRKRVPAQDFGDVPMDDEQLMDDTDVRRLARGPARTEPNDAVSTQQKRPRPTTSHRRNPVTGAMEIDGDALLNHDSSTNNLQRRESQLGDRTWAELQEAGDSSRADASMHGDGDTTSTLPSDFWAQLDAL